MAFVHVSTNGFEVNGKEVSFIDKFVDNHGNTVYDVVNGRTIPGRRSRRDDDEYCVAASQIAAKKLATDPIAGYMARERMRNDRHHNRCGYDSFERYKIREYTRNAVAEEFNLF